MPQDKTSSWQKMQQSYRANLVQKHEQLQHHWHEYMTNNNLVARVQLKKISHQLAGSGAIYGYQDLANSARQLMDFLDLPFQNDLAQHIKEHNAYNELMNTLSKASQCSSVVDQSLKGPPSHQRQHLPQILLIGHDDSITLQLKQNLQDADFEIIHLQTTADLAKTIQHYQPAAIICDFSNNKKQHSANEPWLACRQRPGKHPPLIFIADDDSFEARLTATRAGCSHFMHKPLDILQLIQQLRKLLNISTNDPYRILLVDDDNEVLRFYRQALMLGGYKVYTASNAKQAFDLLYSIEPELIIIDVNMPDCNGLELGQIIRQNNALIDTPLLFISADHHTDEKMAELNLAGDDFIQKPIAPWRLLMSVEARVKRSRMLRQQKRAVIQRPELVQHIDTLTALPTLWQLKRDLAAKLRQQQPFCLMKMDLDQFHLINDAYGRTTGDLLLQTIAWQVAQLLKSDDCLYRENGDEFWLLCMHANSLELAAQFTEQMLLRLEQVSANFDVTIHFSASVGICLVADGRLQVDETMQHTSTALYEAKKKAGHQYRFYDPEQQHKIDFRMRLTQNIRQAISQRQFSCAFQPIFSAEKRLASFEVLARWHHHELGAISPAQFIPLLEEHGLIGYLTQHMLDTGLSQLALWRQQYPALQLNVNFSAQDLVDPSLCNRLSERMKHYKLPHHSLIIEITESILIQAGTSAVDQLNQLAKQGFNIALDDFGTGYSSLSYLDTFPVTKLKIDRSFVQRIDEQQQDKLLPAIIHLAQDLALEITAEGVETHAQYEFLKQFGCERYQGYLFSKPLTAFDIEGTAWFQSKQSRYIRT
ncbi:EAL domain-containing protein [Alkalimonas delamerensis]|uniref:EAL domain-containing protein n=1 Tax=Alkalimonas delamerensis TaxID=265981 RepID=A0ABT9GNE7_9GAMM|nr:EAL domain-containing protein [Alkalimonas delamerensis]MDP4528493.1 EAL domain-containing protein [Alkalimonas delamerensis]